MTTAPKMPEPQVEFDDVPDTAQAETVELRGRTFRLDPRGVSLMGLMEFAVLAERQQQSTTAADEMAAMTALLGLLRECIAEDEWDAFRAHARTVRAGADELNRVMTDAVTVQAARPTRQSSGSPGGPPRTGTSSAAGSSSPVPVGSIQVQHDLEDRGRPDLALVVKRAREESTGSSRR
jgi:hypothetical protein